MTEFHIPKTFFIHPLKARDKVPIFKSWPEKATNDLAVISTWKDRFPDCNYGVATGEISNIVVVDVDPKNGGAQTWSRIERKFGQVTTAECLTGGGGKHLYFQYPKGHNIGNSPLSFGPGVDIRGNRGQVVIPPSIHNNGNQYEWINAPDTVPPAPMPDWLLELILAKGDDGDYDTIGHKMTKGRRNESIYHASLVLARQGASPDFVKAAIVQWCKTNNAKDVTEEEINKSIDSAFKKVQKEEKAKEEAAGIPTTDTDNADLIVSTSYNKIRYIQGMGWYVWNKSFWENDSDDANVIMLATDLMASMRSDALAESKQPGQSKVAAKKAHWAQLSLNQGKLKAAIALASARERIRIEPDDLDSQEYLHLLNTPNALVNLRNGKVVENSPSFYITHQTKINYDPKAECPFWLNTLDLAFAGNKKLINYMQRAVGYSITGSVSEQCLFICWGEDGNNGKSTILEMILKIIGSYGQMSDADIFVTKDKNNLVNSSLAQLPGTRFVTINEADEGQKFNEALIKQITGGDSLQACKKFKEPFYYTPQFKLWLRTNEKPIVRGISTAIWRRLKLIPFETPIPADKRLNRDLVDKKLMEEAEGILNWAVKGAVQWFKHGLQDPAEVTAATNDYRSEMDIVAQFLEECTVQDPEYAVERHVLYKAYVGWSKENGQRFIMSSDGFGKRVRLNANIDKTNNIKHKGKLAWPGMRLTDNALEYTGVY